MKNEKQLWLTMPDGEKVNIADRMPVVNKDTNPEALLKEDLNYSKTVINNYISNGRK